MGYLPLAKPVLALPPTAHVARARLQFVIEESRSNLGMLLGWYKYIFFVLKKIYSYHAHPTLHPFPSSYAQHSRKLILGIGHQQPLTSNEAGTVVSRAPSRPFIAAMHTSTGAADLDSDQKPQQASTTPQSTPPPTQQTSFTSTNSAQAQSSPSSTPSPSLSQTTQPTPTPQPPASQPIAATTTTQSSAQPAAPQPTQAPTPTPTPVQATATPTPAQASATTETPAPATATATATPEATQPAQPAQPAAPQKIYMPWESPIPGGRPATQEEIRETRIQKVSAMEVRRMRGVGAVASAGLAGVGITNVGQLAAITDERCNEIAGACRNIRALRASAQQLLANAAR